MNLVPTPRPRQAAPAVQTRSSNEKPLTLLLTLAAVVLAAGWLLIGVYLYFRLAGPIVSGVRVGDTRVGGLTVEQAAIRIDNDWNRDRVLLVTDGDRYWEGNPLEFGLWVDPNATAKKAFAYGRGENRWTELWDLFTGAQAPDILPEVVFSPQVAAAQLSNWGALVDREPSPATITYENGQWAAKPGADGLVYDPEATLKTLAEQPALILRSGHLQLVTRTVPSSTEGLQQQVAELQAMLDRPLLVHAYDPVSDETLEWPVPKEVLSSWLRADTTSGQLHVTIDESEFDDYLVSVEQELGEGRSFILPPVAYNLTDRWQSGDAYTVVIRHAPATYEVQSGDTLLKIAWQVGIPFWMILNANPGMDMENIPAGSVINLPSKNDLLPLPVVLGKRLELSITDQRLRVFENGGQIRELVVSTGIDKSPTQPGVFQVQTHDIEAYASVWDLTMPHFLGIYEAWPGFMNGFHGLPTLSNGTVLWGSILGRPASFGCIILDLDDAEWLYDWAEDGVVVEITG